MSICNYFLSSSVFWIFLSSKRCFSTYARRLLFTLTLHTNASIHITKPKSLKKIKVKIKAAMIARISKTSSNLCSLFHFLVKKLSLSFKVNTLFDRTSFIFSSAFSLYSLSEMRSPESISLILTPYFYDKICIISTGGRYVPVSQRETVLFVTPNSSPSSSWVKFFSRRSSERNFPIFIISIKTSLKSIYSLRLYPFKVLIKFLFLFNANFVCRVIHQNSYYGYTRLEFVFLLNTNFICRFIHQNSYYSYIRLEFDKIPFSLQCKFHLQGYIIILCRIFLAHKKRIWEKHAAKNQNFIGLRKKTYLPWYF